MIMEIIRIKLNNEYEANFVEDILIENKIEYKKEWRSKYNSYILYDYEPFATEGFMPELTFAILNRNDEFICYLIKKRLNNIKQLEKCLELNNELV